MMSASFNLHISRISKMYPDTVELLANDGKVSANRAFLQLASSAVDRQLTENPEITIFAMKNHMKTTIDCLLHGIYNGKTTFTDEVEKEEVMSLAQELDINITQTELTGEAPKVPEEHIKPQVTQLKSSRCPKLDGYAIANFGVRVEHEVVKMIHYGWSSRVVEWSSGEMEWSSRTVECSSVVVEWSSGVVEWSRAKVEWSSRVVELSSRKSGKVFRGFYINFP